MVACHKYTLTFLFFGNVASAGLEDFSPNAGRISGAVCADIIPVSLFCQLRPPKIWGVKLDASQMLFPNTADSEGQFAIQLANPLGVESQRSASRSVIGFRFDVKAEFLVGPKQKGGGKTKVKVCKKYDFFFPLFPIRFVFFHT